MNIVAVIQARVGSSRLPGKVLKPLLDRPVLEWVIRRAQASRLVTKVVVATSTLPGDDPIEEMCTTVGVTCFRGSEQDVLSRYYGAASENGADVVVRITSDCPFADANVIDQVIGHLLDTGGDYVYNTRERTYPHGLDAEAFLFTALESAHQQATEEYQREHVTPYIRSTGLFRVSHVSAPPELYMPELRITVDTEEDYMLARAIYEELQDGMAPLSSVLSLVRQKPWLLYVNRAIWQKAVLSGHTPALRFAEELVEASRLCMFQGLPSAAAVLARQALDVHESALPVLETQQKATGLLQEARQHLFRLKGE